MKKIIVLIIILFVCNSYAQDHKSWFKLGLNIGLPAGDISSVTTNTLGLNLRGQFLSSKNIGLGINGGYTRFFEKNGGEGFGQIHVAGYFRYFFKDNGPFIGTDLGYAFFVSAPTSYQESGTFINPHVGYNVSNFNFLIYYQSVASKSNVNFANYGLSVEYNF